MQDLDPGSQTATEFWEGIYHNASSKTSGIPSVILEKFAAEREPGNALDLGCAKGDDAVWLAKNGWTVVGVDVAPSVLRIAAENAERYGVSNQVCFEKHDLAETFPDGQFDLISAMFLETPLELPRAELFHRAAKALRRSGLLLIATHQILAPWAWGDPSVERPDGPARLTELDIDDKNWREVFVGSVEREARGPEGQTAQVKDAVIALKKLA
ncbi:class I SAM-dependent methyltransferase [uncultured Ruegeria sp.]|uniref:class I SAM-dependent methyltransferase n=1 Tax=uncultured Ruegeria sp. TaxID=259304 RepID=UPI002601D064|nr:class I SAM-dependent methyltransferase [uncultured Ruegeria sp.]